MQQCSHGSERNSLIKDALHFRIAARQRIANHHQVRRGRQIRFGEAFENGDGERAQQIAHGRICGLVGTGDSMSLQLQQSRERSHRRSADTAQMDMPRGYRHLITAASSRRSSARLAASNSASTPNVSVTFERETCPLRKPIAIGP